MTSILPSCTVSTRNAFCPGLKPMQQCWMSSWVSIMLFPMSIALFCKYFQHSEATVLKMGLCNSRSNDSHFINVNFSRILHANTHMQRLWPSNRHMPYSMKKKKDFPLGPGFVFWLKSAMSQLCFLVEDFCRKGSV